MILRIRGWTAQRLGLSLSAGAALYGIVLFVVYLLIYWMTAISVTLLYPAAAQTRAFQFDMKAAPAAMIAFILINSFFEEIIVTGYVITALSPQGAALSISASTLLRFLYHLYQGPIASISILPLGLLFGGVFWRWRSLWPLIVAHTIANLRAFMVVAARH